MTKALSRFEWLYLAGITVIAGALRFTHLDASALWIDELTLWSVTQVGPITELLASHMKWDASPPLFTFFQYPFTFILKQDEFGVRFPTALIGTLSVPAIYFLGRQFSVRVAVLAAAILAVSCHGIYFSQEARGYSMMIFLCIVTSYFWFRICFADFKRRDIAFYVVAAVALFYTHYYGILFVAGQAVLALFYYRHIGRRNIAAIAVGIIALTSPWVPVLLGEMKPRKFWFGPPEWLDILGYHRYLFDQSAVISIASTVLIFLCLGLLIWNAPPNWRDRLRSVDKILMLALFGIVPFMSAFLRSRYVAPMLYSRCMMIALPSVIVLTAIAADVVSAKFKRYTTWVFAVLAVFFVAAHTHNTFFRFYVWDPNNRDLNREATKLVIELAQKNNLPVLVMGKNRMIISYYFDRYAPDLKYRDIPYTTNDKILEAIKEQIDAKYFIFFSYTIGLDEEPTKVLSSEYTLVKRYHVPRDSYIYVFENNGT